MKKGKKLESIFIKILTKNSKNILAGCIYRHPCMLLKEFNNLFLKSLTNKLNRRNNKEKHY